MFQKLIEWADRQVKQIFGNGPLQRIVKNSSYMMSSATITAGLGFIQTIVITRTLGPIGVGVWGVIKNFPTLFNRITSIRINEMVVKYISDFQENGEIEKAKATFRLSALMEGIGVSIAFILLVISARVSTNVFVEDQSLIALNLTMNDIRNLLILYGVHLLFNIFYNSSRGLIQVFNKFRDEAVLTVVQGVMTFVFIMIAFLLHGGLVGFVIAYLMSKAVLGFGIMAIGMMAARNVWGKGWLFGTLEPIHAELKEMLSFTFSTFFSSKITLIAKDSEIYWVSALLGNEVGGYYTTALSLISYTQILMNPLAGTTYPELSKEVAKENWQEVKTILKRSTRIVGYYVGIGMIGALIFGRLGIRLMYDVEFLPAYPIVLILLLGYFFMNLFYWNRVALLALKRPIYPTVINFIAMLVKVMLLVNFVPPLGELFMAAVLSGYIIITTLMAVIRVYSDLNEKIKTKKRFLEGSLVE